MTIEPSEDFETLIEAENNGVFLTETSQPDCIREEPLEMDPATNTTSEAPSRNVSIVPDPKTSDNVVATTDLQETFTTTPQREKLDPSELVKRLSAIETRTQKQAQSLDERIAAEEADAEIGIRPLPKKQPIVFKPINGQTFHQKPIAPPDWIIENIFEAGDKGDLIGPPKVKKTFVALNLALCVATGRPFLGFKVPKKRKVLYVDMELKEDWLHRREALVTEALGISEDDLKYISWLPLRGKGQDVRTGGEERRDDNGHSIGEEGDALIEAIGKGGYEFVILDCAYKLYKPNEDENKSTSMNAFLDWRTRIAEVTNAAVLIILHDAKGYAGDRGGMDRGVGSNIFARDFDFRFVLTSHAHEEAIVIETFGRNTPSDGGRCARFRDGAIDYDADLFPVKLTSETAKRSQSDAAKGILSKSRAEDMSKALNEILSKAGDKLLSPTILKEKMMHHFPKGVVEDFLRARKEDGTLSICAEYERKAGGGVGIKAHKNGGKTFISTPERITAYTSKFNQLNL